MNPAAQLRRDLIQAVVQELRQGDIVVVWKLDRLARSTKILLEIIEQLIEAGAKFQSLSEPWADTTSPGGKMVMTVFAGIAEFEKDLIKIYTFVEKIEIF